MHNCLNKLTSKYGKGIVLIFLGPLYQTQRRSESSFSHLYWAVFPLLATQRISSFILYWGQFWEKPAYELLVFFSRVPF